MYEFDSYRIYYYSAPQYNWKVALDLYRASVFAGRALFMRPGQPIPANVLQGGRPLLHYSIDDFPNILQVMALDKPLYISLVASNGIGTISTNSEPIGDLDKS